MDAPASSPLLFATQKATDSAELAEPPCLLMFHGFGANEYDLLGLSSSIAPQYNVFSFRAPINLGSNQFAWFNLEAGAGGIEYDLEELDESIELVNEAVDFVPTILSYSPPETSVLGFSQGGGMALATGISRDSEIRKIVVASCLWPDGLEDIVDAEQIQKVKILLIHGINDAMIPIFEARKNQQKLEQLGARVDFYQFNMSHEIGIEATGVIRSFLASAPI